jgi:serine/threonine protein kinase
VRASRLLNTAASGLTYSSAPPLTRIIPYELALIPGTRLGPYEVASQIGVGGMGEVYRATDTNLKRSVAIKVLPASVGPANIKVRHDSTLNVLDFGPVTPAHV